MNTISNWANPECIVTRIGSRHQMQQCSSSELVQNVRSVFCYRKVTVTVLNVCCKDDMKLITAVLLSNLQCRKRTLHKSSLDSANNTTGTKRAERGWHRVRIVQLMSISNSVIKVHFRGYDGRAKFINLGEATHITCTVYAHCSRFIRGFANGVCVQVFLTADYQCLF